jgi:pyruvate dehydrogenase E2 component (dihydrolipoamide acetyltransferase)
VSPIARRLALELGVDLAQVTGTGRNGRVSKQDVEAWAAAHRASPAPKTPAVDAVNPSTSERVSATRAAIARRLLESKQQIPTSSWHHDRCRRSSRIAQRCVRGEAVSLNDLIVRACALALVRHRTLNACFDGEQNRPLPGRRHLRRGCDGDRPYHAGAASANTKRATEIAALAAALTEKARTGV